MAYAGGMKGDGFYDRHSSLQRETFERVFPPLSDALATMPLPEPPATIGVADYGCAEGANSIFGIGRIIERLRLRRPEQAIAAMHTDLPSTDLGRVIRLLNDPSAETYLLAGGRRRAGIFPLVAGGSFYGPVLPPGSVHVAISMLALEWLSHGVAHPPAEHIGTLAGGEQARAEAAAQAASDWATFLAERAREMAPGGRLLVTVPGRDGESWCARGPYELLNDACRALVEAGRIDGGRYRAFCFPVYFRSEEELACVDSVGDTFAVEHRETLQVPPGFERALDEDGDVETWARALVGAFRACGEPSLRAGLLGEGGDPAVLDALFAHAVELARADPRRYRFRNIEVTVLLARR